MKKHLAKGAQILLFFSVGIIILYLVFQRQEAAYRAECALKNIPTGECSLLDKIASDISNAHFGWIAVTISLFMLTNVIRAVRWQMMFRAIGYETRVVNLLGTIMVNYLTNLGIPRSGEVIRAGLVFKYEGVPVEKALGTIFTDRIFDVFMLAIFMVLALFVGGSEFVHYINTSMEAGGPANASDSGVIWFIGVAVPLLVIAAVLWRNRAKLMATNMGKKGLQLLRGFADGVKSISGVSSIPLFILYTVSIWIIYYLMFYFAFFSFDPTAHLGPATALVVFVFGSLGILIPTPGGMGSYHYLVGQGLALYGISGADGFSFANIVFFSIQLLANILFGLLFLILLPLLNKK